MSAASRKAWFDARRCVGIWLTHAEYAKCKNAAEQDGITVSAFAREQVVSSLTDLPAGRAALEGE